MSAFAVGGSYVASCALLVWAVETDVVRPDVWVPLWIVLGGAIAVAGVVARRRAQDD